MSGWAGPSASGQLWPVLGHWAPGYIGLGSELIPRQLPFLVGFTPWLDASQKQENLAHDSGPVLHRGRSWGQKSNGARGL